jgi:small subunit ribosomal protein S17
VRTRKLQKAVVVSDKMQNTAIVSFERRTQHPVYKKVITKTTKIVAENLNNDAKQGDTVLISPTRPMSKTKRWKIVKVLEKSTVKE